MGAGGDLVLLDDGGDDNVESGGGNDFLYFGNAFTVGDSVNAGAGNDTVGLLGNYQLTLGAASLIGVEKLALYGAGSTTGASFNYDITTLDANVGVGKRLMVVGLSLSAGETLVFNGSAETDGSFNIRGGKGGDTLTGGAGADILRGGLGEDILRGGAGNDLFEYQGVADSALFSEDRIMDFAAGDRIKLSAIDADGNAANGNSKFTFIGGEQFSSVAGELRASRGSFGEWVVEADTNGDGLADLSILVNVSSGHLLGAADFVL
jgi:Ca2+-binding RTX toxin-like protein